MGMASQDGTADRGASADDAMETAATAPDGHYSRYVFSVGTTLYAFEGTNGTPQAFDEIAGRDAGDATVQDMYALLGYDRILYASAGGSGYYDMLAVSDGTAPGTLLSPDDNSIGGPRNFYSLGHGEVMFQAIFYRYTKMLYISDGTTDGTRAASSLVDNQFMPPDRDVQPLAGGWATIATWADGITTSWITDGSREHTLSFAPQTPITSGGSLGGGRLLVWTSPYDLRSGQSVSLGHDLWVSDGTTSGTALLRHESADLSSEFYSFNGNALFHSAGTAYADAPWISDGTVAGTFALADIAFEGAARDLGNGRAIFRAADAAHGAEYWATDGTAAGTHLLADFAAGAAGSVVDEAVLIGGGKALLTVHNGSEVDLWTTDGGSATLLAGVPERADFGRLGEILSLGDGRALYSLSSSGAGSVFTQIWVTDGSPDGTVLLDVGTDLPEIADGGYRLADGRVIFRGHTEATGTELWITDGTAAGTRIFFESAEGPDSLPMLNEMAFVRLGNAAPTGALAVTGAMAEGGTAFAGRGTLADFDGLGALTYHWLRQEADGSWSDRTQADGTAHRFTWDDVGHAFKVTASYEDGRGLVETAGSNAFRIGFAEQPGVDGQGFDRAFYLAANPDVAAAGVDAWEHFKAHGAHEGRDPDQVFDVSFYLNQNPDVAAAGVNPLEHYMAHGWKEGRAPSLSFDGDAYLRSHPEVAQAGSNPLLHFLQSGKAEGFQAIQTTPHAAAPQNALVDAAFYFSTYGDVAREGVDPTRHFMTHGWQEGRDPDTFFDTDWYLAHNADVAAAGVNPLEHYLLFGAPEGRDPSALFNGEAYLAHNPDVAAAGMNPLEHYLLFGLAEHREIYPA